MNPIYGLDARVEAPTSSISGLEESVTYSSSSSSTSTTLSLPSHSADQPTSVPGICGGNSSPWAWTPGVTEELKPPTETLLTELDELGVSDEDYQTFLKFVGHPFDFNIRFPDGSPWSAVRSAQRLTHRRLVNHLAGRCWVATGVRRALATNKRQVTRFFVIDLDQPAQPQRGRISLLDGFDRVQTTLGEPSLTFTSSSSGGLHLYYLLSDEVDLYRLRDRVGTGGAITKLLAAEGLYQESGFLEFYPASNTRFRAGNPLRLPFGTGSVLRDPTNSMIPVTGHPLRDLSHVTRKLESQDVKIYHFEELFDAAYSLPAAQPSKSPTRRKSGRRTGGIAASLLKDGLTRPGQRHSAVSSLALHYRARGFTEDEAIEVITEWQESKHNGMSSTYTRNPKEAHADIVAVVGEAYLQNLRLRVQGLYPPVTQAEAEHILAVTSGDLDHCDTRTGEVLFTFKRFRLQSVLFDMLRAHKQYVLDEGQTIFETLATEFSGCDQDPNLLSMELSKSLRTLWPSPEEMKFNVTLPSTYRRSMKGMCGKNGIYYWNAAKVALGHRQTRKSNGYTHKSELYSVTLDFRLEDENTPVFFDLPRAIAAVLDSGDIRKLYTTTHQRAIRKDAAAERVVEPFALGSFASFLSRHQVHLAQMVT